MRKNDGKSFETDVNKCPDYFTMSSVDECVCRMVMGVITGSCDTAKDKTSCETKTSCMWRLKGHCFNEKKLGNYGHWKPDFACNLINEEDTHPRVGGDSKLWDSKANKKKYAKICGITVGWYY